MSERAIPSTVESLQWIYGVVLALSLGEAFTQVVLPPDSTVPGIQWDRLPSLCSVLLLVVPFYHGMSRFFCEMYGTKHIGHHYGLWLLLDCFVFTIEAGLFFVLARSLPKDLWWQFGWTVMILLFLDIQWGSLVWRFRSSAISWWVIINLWSIPCLATVLFISRSRNSWWAISLVTLILLARTAADYWTGWEFYCPRIARSHSHEGHEQ